LRHACAFADEAKMEITAIRKSFLCTIVSSINPTLFLVAGLPHASPSDGG
jgi:hypothetical protein